MALSTDEAVRVFGTRMVEQDYPLAASFAEVRADEKRDELEHRQPRDGDARVSVDGMISWHSGGQWSTPSRMPM